MAIKPATGTARNAEISFDIEGEEQISAAFDFIGDKFDDMKEPLRRSGGAALKDWDKNFDTEGKTIEEPWAPLSPAYAARKAQLYPGAGILVRSGRMRGAFKEDLKKLSTTLFNTASYFKYHQSNRPRRKLPRRVMMKISNQLRKKIFSYFTEFFNETVAHFERS